MESTSDSTVPKYRASQHVRVDGVDSKFANKESIKSSQFFCREDPQPVLFHLELLFGTERANWLGVTVRNLSHKVTVTSISSLIVGELDPGKKIGGSSDYKKRWVLEKDKLYGWVCLKYKKDLPKTKWHIIVEIVYERDSSHPAATEGSLDPTLPTDYTKLFEHGQHSDVTFVIHGENIRAHKSILGARCSYFERMFQSDMKENRTNEIDVNDVKADVFKELLRFLYSGQSPKYSSQVTMGLLAVADRYGVDLLKSTCESLLGSNLSTNNVIEALLQADKRGWTALKECAMTFVKAHGAKLKEEEKWTELRNNPSLLLELLEFSYD